MEKMKKNFVYEEAKQLYEIKNKRTDISNIVQVIEKIQAFEKLKNCKVEDIVKKSCQAWCTRTYYNSDGKSE